VPNIDETYQSEVDRDMEGSLLVIFIIIRQWFFYDVVDKINVELSHRIVEASTLLLVCFLCLDKFSMFDMN
jgi:hypothetical protein